MQVLPPGRIAGVPAGAVVELVLEEDRPTAGPSAAFPLSTARGFEPLRAEPNGFLVHHLNHSVTLSLEVSAPGKSFKLCLQH